MESLPKRRTYWETYHTERWQGPSLPNPYADTENFAALYRQKNVLELGPGDGRQFKELSPLAATYSIADIVPAVLHKSLYDQVPKFVIQGWDDTLPGHFDTICFWYVFHHITKAEVSAFLAFLVRHLVPDGCLHFNLPGAVPNSCPGGDGVMTTDWTLDEVTGACGRHHLYLQSVIAQRVDSVTCLVRRYPCL